MVYLNFVWKFEMHLKRFALHSTRKPQGCSTVRIFRFIYSFISIFISLFSVQWQTRDVDFSTHAFRQICFQMTELYSRLERQDKIALFNTKLSILNGLSSQHLKYYYPMPATKLHWLLTSWNSEQIVSDIF